MPASFSVYKNNISVLFPRYVSGGLAAFSVCYFSGIMLFMGNDPALNSFAFMELFLHRPATHSGVMHYILTVSISFACFALLTPAAVNCIRVLYARDEELS
jgi:hypothetical protein